MKALLAAMLALVPLTAQPVQVLSRGASTLREVALTFDAGADRGNAAHILSTLERNHIKASFGMTGAWASANSDLVRRMVRDGDLLMNHTYDHRSFTGYSTHASALTNSQRTWEIEQADRVIRSISGRHARPYFRPPFGDYDAATLDLLKRLGYGYMVMWTLDSLGWEHLSATSIERRCLRGISPGAIVLMHVGSQSQDSAALQTVVTALKGRHYAFVTVSAFVSKR
ncbi:MAG: polysaccharide deacetylase family protein [Chloroflexota bacterium]